MYQYAFYAAQDEESKESVMREMWCREGNVRTHSMRMPGVGEDKHVDSDFVRMDPDEIKPSRLSSIVS